MGPMLGYKSVDSGRLVLDVFFEYDCIKTSHLDVKDVKDTIEVQDFWANFVQLYENGSPILLLGPPSNFSHAHIFNDYVKGECTGYRNRHIKTPIISEEHEIVGTGILQLEKGYDKKKLTLRFFDRGSLRNLPHNRNHRLCLQEILSKERIKFRKPKIVD